MNYPYLIILIILLFLINSIAYFFAKIKFRSHLNRFTFYPIPDYLQNTSKNFESPIKFFLIPLFAMFLSQYSLDSWSPESIIFRGGLIIIFFLSIYWNYYMAFRKYNIEKIVIKAREDLLDGISYMEDNKYKTEFFLKYAQAHQYVLMWHELSPRGIVYMNMMNGNIPNSKLHDYFSFPAISKANFFKELFENGKGVKIVSDASKDFPPKVLQHYNKELDLLSSLKK